jgi:hypothetical protein
MYRSTVWERGPGRNSDYWSGVGMPGAGVGPGIQVMRGAPPYGEIPQAPIANAQTRNLVTVPYRPTWSPTGMEAKGMYSGPLGIVPLGLAHDISKSKWLILAGLIGVGALAAVALKSKKMRRRNPKAKMKFGERIVRIGGGAALTGLGMIGWFGPQAAEPISTVVGLPVSAGGIYLALSGLLSPEKAKAIRKEVKG